MSGRTRVLIVEDLPTDAELVKREVRRAMPDSEFLTVETRDGFLDALASFRPDYILSDYSLPEFDGLSALHLAKERVPDTPFIIVTGSMNEDTAVECMKSGAWDYVIKEQIRRLGPAVVGALEQRRLRIERKQTVEVLREREERYSRLFNSSNDSIFVHSMNPDGTVGSFTEVNDVACERLGYSREELLNMTPIDITLGGMNEARRAALRDLADKGSVVFEIVHVNREERALLAEVSSRVFESGGKRYVLSIARDITERKRAEEALRDSLDRFQLASRATYNIIWDWDIKADTHWTNENYCGLFGYAPEGAPQGIAVWMDHLHPEDKRRVMAGIQAAVSDGRETWTDEYRVQRADGTYAIVMDRGIIRRDAAGRALRMIGAMEDVSARKAAEADRERLSAAIEQAAEAVLITDASGTIQYVNPAFTAMSGYSREEALGNNPRMLNSGAQDVAFYREMWGTISSDRTWHGRLVDKRKDGELFTVEATLSPVVDAGGRITNHVAVSRDITESLRLSDQLQQAQKMESVGRLAGGVAHDFNNMLGVILGHTELALSQLDPTQPLYEDLQQILKATQRSAGLTRQLLAFARKQTIAPQVLDLNATVEGMLKMLRRLIGEDVELAWLPDADPWTIKIDPSEVDQIMANLCVNARDAISGVGRVTIETQKAVLDRAFCDDHAGVAPGDFVLLIVRDNGCGMDQEVQEHLFEPFFTTKEAGKGTGMGLATVYGIVTQNHGLIEVLSEPGDGTTFKVYLPRHEEEPAPVAKAEGAKPAHAGREVILLVEDEPAVLELGRRMLSKAGYIMLTASSSSEALHIAAQHPGGINLLMTDVVMPGMNGRELANQVRRIRPEIHCLFMSGYTADVIAHRGVLDEGTHFVQKPFAMRDLAAKVREALDTP